MFLTTQNYTDTWKIGKHFLLVCGLFVLPFFPEPQVNFESQEMNRVFL